MEESQQRRLEVESVDLGADVRAVGLELINLDDREPIVGADAAEIWSALVPVLAGGEPFRPRFFLLTSIASATFAASTASNLGRPVRER